MRMYLTCESRNYVVDENCVFSRWEIACSKLLPSVILQTQCSRGRISVTGEVECLKEQALSIENEGAIGEEYNGC